MTQKQFHVTLVTLFPEIFPGPLGVSLAGKALQEGIWGYNTLNLRDFGLGKHHTVDDTPFGGGAGMVIRPDVIDAALTAARDIASQAHPQAPSLFYLSPRGKRLTQPHVKTLVNHKNLIILCGRFEGVDQRVLDFHQMEEISAGDFVLSGGDVAALVMLDACIRLLPGVVGEAASLEEESFSVGDGPFSGLLEYPQYTRPAEWKGLHVPEVLLSGHHARIQEWRLNEAKAITKTRRPDVWNEYASTKHPTDKR